MLGSDPMRKPGGQIAHDRALLGAWLLGLAVCTIGGCTTPKPNLSGDAATDTAVTDTGLDSGDDAETDTGIDAGVCDDERVRECDGVGAMCETYVWNDPTQCGACGRVCDTGQRCIAGACTTPIVSALAMGSAHGCALLSDGHVVCWGSDMAGQLGEGLSSEMGVLERHVPVAVRNLDDADVLVSRGDYSCAIRDTSRQVVCWGQNNPNKWGPIEPQSLYTVPEPLVFIDPTERAESMSLALGHLAVHTESDRILTAGLAAASQLGRETGIARHFAAAIEGAPTGDRIAVATGGSSASGHTCVVIDGAVYCVGYNGCAQAGQPDSMVRLMDFTRVPGLANIVDVVSGQNYTCALDDAGAVHCWGCNSSGELGIDPVDLARHPPAVVSGLPPVGQIIAASSTMYAVTTSGEAVWGWGDASEGQLGLGMSEIADQPAPRELIAQAGSTYEVSTSNSLTCLLERRAGTNPRILCAGRNIAGGIGFPTSERARNFTFEPHPFFE